MCTSHAVEKGCPTPIFFPESGRRSRESTEWCIKARSRGLNINIDTNNISTMMTQAAKAPPTWGATQRARSAEQCTCAECRQSQAPTLSVPAELVAGIRRLAPLRASKCPAHLVPLLSDEGINRLSHAETLGGPVFVSMAERHFTGQGPLQCGFTSLAIALNTMSPHETVTADHLAGELRSHLAGQGNEPFPPWTGASPYWYSASLSEIRMLGALHNAATTATPADRSSLSEFRLTAMHELDAGRPVVVQFDRAAAGYASHFAGHMSPLGGYHPASDTFLVLDVAIKTWQPAWIPAGTLFEAMKTTDKPRDDRCRAECRGYLTWPVVSDVRHEALRRRQ